MNRWSTISILIALVVPQLASCKRSGHANLQSLEPLVLIQVAYPGASPAEVEQGLTLAIEEAVRSPTAVTRIESYSLEGQALIEIFAKKGTDAYELASLVREEVQRASTSFPEDAEQPTIWTAPPPLTVLIPVTGDLDPGGLQRIASDLRYDLMQLPGIRSAQVLGRRQRQVLVEVDPERLMAFGLTASQLANRLTSEGLELPAGEGGFVIRTTGRVARASELENLVIQADPTGRVIRLRDLATIRDDLKEPQVRVRSRHHGVALALHLAHDKHGTLTFNKLPDILAAFKNRVPPGLALGFHSLTIRDARRTVLGRVRAPAGTSLEELDRILGPMYEAMKKAPGNIRHLGITGSAGLRLPGRPSIGQATFIVTVNKPKAAQAVAAFLNGVAAQVPGAKIRFQVLSDILTPGSRLEVLITGLELDAMAQATDRIAKELKSKDTVANVWGADQDRKPELSIAADREKLARMGLTHLDVVSAIRLATSGQEVQRFLDGRDEVRVVLKVGRSSLDSPEELNRISVPTPTGAQVTLGSVVRLTRTMSPVSIHRIDGRRVVRLEVDLARPVDGDRIEAWRKALWALAPKGGEVRLRFLGAK